MMMKLIFCSMTNIKKQNVFTLKAIFSGGWSIT